MADFDLSDCHHANHPGVQLQSFTYKQDEEFSRAQPFVYSNASFVYQETPFQPQATWNMGMDSSDRTKANEVEVISVDIPTEGEDQNDTERPPPIDYFHKSVIVTIFCCLAFGVEAIRSSVYFRKAKAARKMAIAEVKSNEARAYISLSLLTGIVMWIVIAGFLAVGLTALYR